MLYYLTLCLLVVVTGARIVIYFGWGQERWILVWVLLGGLLGVAVGVRILCGVFDRKRIQASAERAGWRDVTVRWTPWARGWWLDRVGRQYRVDYLDETGQRWECECRTWMLGGVCWGSASRKDVEGRAILDSQ